MTNLGTIAGKPNSLMLPAQYTHLIEEDKCEWNELFNGMTHSS